MASIKNHLMTITKQSTDRGQNLFLALGVGTVATFIFALLLIVAYPALQRQLESPLVLLFGILGYLLLFIMAMMVAFFAAMGIFIQFVQRMYNLTPKEATTFAQRMIYGLPEEPPFSPVIAVRQGHIMDNAPNVLRKVGGPGFLSVGHDNAVVLSRGGILVKVLGPGWYRLEAFEKVWRVVDLRTQRREVTVETNTRDGIPITCQAEIRFHVDNGEDTAHAWPFTDVSQQSVFKLATGIVALAPGGLEEERTWMKRIGGGKLDGQIRNWLEQYRMDELLSPERQLPVIAELQAAVTEATLKAGQELGLKVEQVIIKSLLPSEKIITEQWFEMWRSKWDYQAHKEKAIAKAEGTEIVKLARLQAQTDLVSNLIHQLKDVDLEDRKISPELVHLRFLDVVRSLAESDPLVRSTMFKEAKGLGNIIESLQSLPNPDTE
ncbi:MAG: SPFH domain-containing protein [Chloroflexota bacterium]|nr:SPFH domain-containing protein [Chloroflexota bacterium]